MIPENILRSFDKKTVVVTGGTGMIGRQIVDILAGAGARVRSVSMDRLKIHASAEYVYGDLSDFGFCKEITKNMDFVFHVAGIKGSIDVTKEKPASCFVPLLMMNTNVLEACRVNRVQKAVYTSSIGAYSQAEILKESEGGEGPPMDFFPGWAKRMGEMQVQTYRQQYKFEYYSVVRLCNVYGPGDNFDPANAMVIPSLIHKIFHKQNPVVVWGDGSAIRDFAYSRDVAEGVILALHYGTSPGFMNLSGGRGYSVKELVETLRSFIPFEYTFDTRHSSGFPKRVMDIRLAREKLGYQPSTSLLDGLKQTWEWYTQNQNEHLNKINYFKEL